MPDDEGRFDSVADPVVPVVNLHVCTADGRGFYADEDFVEARVGSGPFLVGGAGSRGCFNDAVHLLFQSSSSNAEGMVRIAMCKTL